MIRAVSMGRSRTGRAALAATTQGYGCIELRFYEYAGTVLLTRFTCSASGVSTHYDDTNSVTLQRFRTTSPKVYSGYEYGYGH